MAIVRGKDALNSFSVRKKFSVPNQYGVAVYAISYYGHYNLWAGIYQQRPRATGRLTVKEKYYWPTNPQTAPQQANRNSFAAAVLAWQGLTDEQKEHYRERAKRKQMSGYNLYIKEYMLP